MSLDTSTLKVGDTVRCDVPMDEGATAKVVFVGPQLVVLEEPDGRQFVPDMRVWSGPVVPCPIDQPVQVYLRRIGGYGDARGQIVAVTMRQDLDDPEPHERLLPLLLTPNAQGGIDVTWGGGPE